MGFFVYTSEEISLVKLIHRCLLIFGIVLNLVDGGNKITTDDGETWEVINPDGGYPDDAVVGLDNEPGYTELLARTLLIGKLHPLV